jgi:hypothetical protein
MGAKIYSTSTIDAWLNIPRIIVTFIYITVFVGVLFFPLIQFDILKKINIGETGNVIVAVILLIGGIFLSRYIFGITAGRFFNTLSSFIYVRQELNTKISWKNAAYVSFLFTPNPTGKWYTMYGVLRLPEEQRLGYILDFADKLYKELKLK